MTKRKRIVVTIAASLAGLVIVLVIAAILVLKSAWFSNFVREKAIAAIEESTGGTVEIGAFQFDLTHLTIRIRDFVLHGTEPRTSDPLARIALLEVRLKLFSAFKKIVDLQYLGIQKPEVDLIVFPDGKTNVPEPKVKKPPSQTSGLETVVDLAINRFEIQNGLIEFAQQKTAFSAQGENLRAILNYNAATPAYQGNLSIDPLILASGTRPPLNVHVNLPVTLEKDAVNLAGARLTTDQSQILVDASLQNMNAPVISAHLNANVSLPEVQQIADLPIDTKSRDVPKVLAADVAVRMDEKRNALEIQTAHVGLGQTTFQASGALDPSSKNSAVQFNGNLALSELGRLLKLTSAQPGGDLLLKGTASLDAHNNYSINGALDSHDLSISSGTTRISNMRLYAPFHADPYLISVDRLTLDALGGELGAKVFIEKMEQLSLESTLRNFSLPVLATVFTGKQLGYDGAIDGSLNARGNLKAKGTTGYSAQANLAIISGNRGVPVNGRLKANFVGATGAMDLDNSYIALPRTRLDLSGSLNKQINLKLVSHDLNDFLPAVNFGAAKPETSLPVTLQGGTASLQAQVNGDLSAPHVSSHLDVNNFAVEQRGGFDRLALDLAASPSGAVIQNGLLTRKALHTNFDASIGLHKWTPLPQSPLTANLTLRNGDIADLLSLAGETSASATGQLTADVHVKGTYGNPLGGAAFQVLNGSAYQQPIDRLYTKVDLADRLVTLSTLELKSGAARIALNGSFQHPRESFTVGHAQFHIAASDVQLANIQPLVQRSPGVAGLIQLTADAAADLRNVNKQSQITVSSISTDLSARGLQVEKQSAGELTAVARTVNGTVNYTLKSDFAGSNINVTGHTVLRKDYPTTADASIQNLSIEKALQIVGQPAIPASGNLSANAHVAGTMQAPEANLKFALMKANVYQEPIDRFQGTVEYSNTKVNIPSIELAVPAGSVTLNGSFTHPANNFNSGALKLKLDSSDINLAKIEHIEEAGEGIAGILRLATDLSANIREQHGKPTVLFSNLNANASANSLRMNDRDLGEASFTARTTGSTLNFRLDSNLAKSQIHASGQSQLTGDYPVRADLSFSNIRYTNIAPFLSPGPSAPPAFEALVEGRASVNGPILQTGNMTGRLELSRLDFRTNPGESPTGAPPGRTVELQNQGPIVVALDRSVVRVQQLAIQGPDTSITASGAANLKNANAPLGLHLDANVNLGLLQDIDRDFYSSGNLSLTALVRGSFSQPLINGQVELKNANVNYAGAPNGLSNGNGLILLNGTSATIQKLTGESGGGKISMTGFVGFANSLLTYNLHAAATKVRVRYAGVSVTSNAAINLIGNYNRSLLDGEVSIQRIAYAATSDAGSFLSSFASTPPSTPSAPSGLLAGMRLDIHILTAPDLRVVTTYAEKLTVEANLTVRGTAINPGVVGRVSVTEGKLVFFGNTYTVNTGTINFYNPNAIQPIVNISLETVAQGVDVTLGVSGPADNLRLSYRSDPPLTFEQIVQLLATNTTPFDPNVAANQPPEPQQSFTQMGESAILGQAVANPLASRVQRVFGLSQLKIDPSFQSSNGQPTARVTLQQKIANNITFTYITDVSQSNDEIIRVEWDLTSRLSAVGLRDYNGNVSIEFFYKFKVR